MSTVCQIAPQNTGAGGILLRGLRGMMPAEAPCPSKPAIADKILCRYTSVRICSFDMKQVLRDIFSS